MLTTPRPRSGPGNDRAKGHVGRKQEGIFYAGAPGDRREERVGIPYDERQSEPHRPRVMRFMPRGVGRSVDRGVGGPGIEPRNKISPGRRRLPCGGRQHGGVRYRQRSAGPAWSEALARRRNLLYGNREISWLAV